MRLEELRARRKHRLFGRRENRAAIRGTVMLIIGAAAMLAIFYMLGARCSGEPSGRVVVPAGDNPGRGTAPADAASTARLAPRSQPVRAAGTAPVASRAPAPGNGAAQLDEAGVSAAKVGPRDSASAVLVVTVLPQRVLAGEATLLEWGRGASPDPGALAAQLSRLAARGGPTRVRLRAASATAFRLVTAVQNALREAGFTVTVVERAD